MDAFSNTEREVIGNYKIGVAKKWNKVLNNLQVLSK